VSYIREELSSRLIEAPNVFWTSFNWLSCKQICLQIPYIVLHEHFKHTGF
jgi:hypothetical protein